MKHRARPATGVRAATAHETANETAARESARVPVDATANETTARGSNERTRPKQAPCLNHPSVRERAPCPRRRRSR